MLIGVPGMKLSLSIGYAYFDPDDDKVIDDIVKSADKMMYEKKLKFKEKHQDIDLDRKIHIID